MTRSEKHQLQDLFEGAMDGDTALAILNLADDIDATSTWRRWEVEMDEQGNYNF